MDKTDATEDSTPRGSSRQASVPGAEKQSPLVLEEYNFNHKRRGKCLIINNRYFEAYTGQSEREGTDVDAVNVSETFQELGFDVERCDNLSSIDLSMKLQKVAKEDHDDADCFVCVVLSHGKSGYIFATDGTVSVETLTKHFKGDVCESLAGKPKLFFIQACRGTKLDYGVDVKDEVDAVIPEEDNLTRIPTESDFLMAYSVVPGFYSWRNNVDGSWFIQALCRVLREVGETMELMNLMTLVNKLVAYDFSSSTGDEWDSNSKQMPCIVSMLTRMVYFYSK